MGDFHTLAKTRNSHARRLTVEDAWHHPTSGRVDAASVKPGKHSPAIGGCARGATDEYRHREHRPIPTQVWRLTCYGNP
ncbi:MAG: hypothetical protein K0S70_784 [Microbacterium sp.]|jgi:hypothetical protein|nr:hypothetical protein [Microbacterium sp.]